MGCVVNKVVRHLEESFLNNESSLMVCYNVVHMAFKTWSLFVALFETDLDPFSITRECKNQIDPPEL